MGNQMRRRDQKYDLRLLRVLAHRADDRVRLHRRKLTLLLEVQDLLLLERGPRLQVDDGPVLLWH